MGGCCDDGCELEVLRERQSRTLKAVLTINAVMFFIIVGAGLYAGSVALLSDSLDNLGDAVTYALSLYAVRFGARTKARVALVKGFLILLGAQIGLKLSHPVVPMFEMMGSFSLLAKLAGAHPIISQ